MENKKFNVNSKSIPDTKEWHHTATRILNELLEKHNKLAEDYIALKKQYEEDKLHKYKNLL